MAQAIAAMCEEFDLATTVDDYRGLFQSVNGQTNLLDVVLNAYVVRLKRESAKDNRGEYIFMKHLTLIKLFLLFFVLLFFLFSYLFLFQQYTQIRKKCSVKKRKKLWCLLYGTSSYYCQYYS